MIGFSSLELILLILLDVLSFYYNMSQCGIVLIYPVCHYVLFQSEILHFSLTLIILSLFFLKFIAPYLFIFPCKIHLLNWYFSFLTILNNSSFILPTSVSSWYFVGPFFNQIVIDTVGGLPSGHFHFFLVDFICVITFSDPGNV